MNPVGSTLISEDDFRSSIEKQDPIGKKYPEYVEELAIKASHAANFENCGVDILIDHGDFVAEHFHEVT